MSKVPYYHKSLGLYNRSGTEKNWYLLLSTQFGNVDALFDKDDEPDTDGLLPSEVIELLAKRIESYWIHTSRIEKRNTIETIRSHALEIDKAWLEQQIVIAEQKVQGLKDRLSELEIEDISA